MVESMAMRVYRSAFGRAHFYTFKGCLWRNSTNNGRRLVFPVPIFSSSLSRLRFCTKVVQGQDQGDRLNPSEVRASASLGKPLDQWSEEDVQQWFKATKYQKYAAKFMGLDGKEVVNLAEEQCRAITGNIALGSAIYNTLQALKIPTEGREVATLDDLQNVLASKNISLRLPRPANEYAQWNNPPPDMQQQVQTFTRQHPSRG